jgi:phage terminase large subunit
MKASTRKQYSTALDLSRACIRRARQLQPLKTSADTVREYRDDILGFARDVLGVQPWSRQAEILRAVLSHKRVSVVSGHKVGKSTALAIVALWFYCSFPGARVVIMATTDRQVNGIIWREIKRLVRNSRIPIPGADEIHQRALAGLENPADFAEIKGYTAKEAEGAAGVSGSHILYLIDEASGVDQRIFEAIEGNRAGGNAWVFLISNPTRAEGEFYDSHHSKRLHLDAADSTGYFCIHIDSRESPNVTGEWRELQEWDPERGEWRLWREPIPGLADPEWCAEKLREWGADSVLFLVRVAGVFVAAEEAKAFPVALLADATERRLATDATGRLWIGCVPAGEGDGGDESAFSARRGLRHLEVRARRALSNEAHLAELKDLFALHGDPAVKLRPVVVLDTDGEVGWRLFVFLREYADRTRDFELVRIRAQGKPVHKPQVYMTARDEIAANARDWLRAGGTLLEHTKLHADLAAYEFQAGTLNRLKLISKRDLRAKLGRSPDAGDAFMLSCWEPTALRAEDVAGRELTTKSPAAARTVFDERARPAINPYGGLGYGPPRRR